MHPPLKVAALNLRNDNYIGIIDNTIIPQWSANPMRYPYIAGGSSTKEGLDRCLVDYPNLCVRAVHEDTIGGHPQVIRLLCPHNFKWNMFIAE